MDILGKARKLESRIARTFDSAAQRLVGPGGGEPLEILHAIVDTVEQQVQPAGRGRRVFPFNRIKVSVIAISRDARARLEAVIDGQPNLHERILERLRSAGCDVRDLGVKITYVARAATDWTSPTHHVEFARVTPELEVSPGPAAAPQNRIELTVMRGAAERRTYSFSTTRIDLGRCHEVRDRRNRLVRTNHVAFTEGAAGLNQTVSRRHAHIVCNPESGAFRVHDDGSAQGTSVVRNGRTIAVPSGSRGIRLHSGDEVVLGEARIRVKIDKEVELSRLTT